MGNHQIGILESVIVGLTNILPENFSFTKDQDLLNEMLIDPEDIEQM